MKSTEVAISSLSSSLLILLLFLSGPSPAFSSQPNPVLDIHGHPLLTGTKYYIVPLIRGAGSGGPTMAAPRNGTCPLDVVQDHPLLDGLPVKFTLSEGSHEKGTAVHTSTSLKIKFTGRKAETVNTCQSSMRWSVGSNDEETGLRTITTGSSTSVFTIEKLRILPTTGNYYKLVYCGSSICVGGGCTFDNVCRAVGLHGRRLYAGGLPFGLYFQKA